jgi:hypothetical protein
LSKVSVVHLRPAAVGRADAQKGTAAVRQGRERATEQPGRRERRRILDESPCTDAVPGRARAASTRGPPR